MKLFLANINMKSKKKVKMKNIIYQNKKRNIYDKKIMNKLQH